MLQDRFHHQRTDVLYPIRKPTKPGLVPSAYEQCSAIGGHLTRIAYGFPDYAVANFSPCLTVHNNTPWISWRTQPEPFIFRWDNHYFYNNERPTEVFLGILEDDDRISGAHSIRPMRHKMSYEDPRLFIGSDEEMYCQFVSSRYASQFNKGGKDFFDTPKIWVSPITDGYATRAVLPPQGGNRQKGVSEKNWCYFTHKGITKLLYSTLPLLIYEDESGGARQIPSRHLRRVCEDHPTFNSTAPIDLNGEHLVFYHWKFMTTMPNGQSYLQYHTSAYMLDRDMTKITHMVNQPLWSGSLEDEVIWWTTSQGQKMSTQPACILPFGGVVQKDELVLPLGVNDAWIGIFRCKLDNIMAFMEPC